MPSPGTNGASCYTAINFLFIINCGIFGPHNNIINIDS